MLSLAILHLRSCNFERISIYNEGGTERQKSYLVGHILIELTKVLDASRYIYSKYWYIQWALSLSYPIQALHSHVNKISLLRRVTVVLVCCHFVCAINSKNPCRSLRTGARTIRSLLARVRSTSRTEGPVMRWFPPLSTLFVPFPFFDIFLWPWQGMKFVDTEPRYVRVFCHVIYITDRGS